MKRVALVLLLLATLGGAAVATGTGGEPLDPTFTVELDNAFGLIDGADVKVAGVRAGSIRKLRIDKKTYRALVDIEIKKEGFGELRKDVFCESRPQSLIGEYFLDCLPGTDPVKLKPGARIPVEQTGSTIPADLINNIMRRPFRERFSILIGELGAALAARGEDLNETIRRANPALREVDRLLASLAEQRTVIRDLTDDAEDVVVELADNKKEVTRFVREARDTSAASAERYDGLRDQFQKFPTFLRELRPTMQLLGEAADRQRPALTNLSEQAPLLRRFLDDLGPFAEASRPAFRSLAAAGRQGRQAIKVTVPRIKELGAFASVLPEVVTNLAITLEHLDDRRFAVEKDPRAPGGQGFTGYEAILQYIFRQSQAINVFDDNSYLLKVSAFLDPNCANYTDAAGARNPERQYCRAILGPSQPGIDQPDPTSRPGPPDRAKKRAGRRDDDAAAQQREDEALGNGPASSGGNGGGGSAPQSQQVLPGPVQDLLDDVLPSGRPAKPVDPSQSLPLLDFLLGG
jgi:ABC-type transporter Mla subunit MlaD